MPEAFSDERTPSQPQVVVMHQKEPSNGNGKLKARDWLAIVGLILAIAGASGTIATSVFWSRADGAAADARFSSHAETQKEFEKNVQRTFEKIDHTLEKLNDKLK